MKTIEWGYAIVLYLFLGGLSAGLFFVSALSCLWPQKNDSYNRIARYGALLAPWPLLLGCSLLVFDLGRWYRFWKLFAHFQYTSPMSIGSWLLAVFSLVSLIYFYSWLSVEQRRFSVLKKLNFAVPEPWQRRLAALGLPLSAGVGIYTGVLLGAVQSRPFWNTNIVAQLFLFSALSSGCAAIMLALAWRNEALESLSFRTLLGFDAILLMLELFIVIPYVIHGELSVQAVKDSMRLILGGPFTIPFWIFFAGLGVLAPLGLELVGLASSRHNRRMIAVTASLILAGGFVLRYIFVFAGQMSTFN